MHQGENYGSEKSDEETEEGQDSATHQATDRLVGQIVRAIDGERKLAIPYLGGYHALMATPCRLARLHAHETQDSSP